MSQVHAMSDEQVSGELKKMTAFILQEAHEKAAEISTKAEHEFAVEKAKLVRQETSSIDVLYEKKFKQASMSQQITRSTVANKTRLRVLNERQTLLDKLFDEAKEKLVTLSKDKSKYQEILKNLILEGAYALNEDKLEVTARKADYDVVKPAIEKASSEYKSKVNKEVKITIDESDPLPEDSAGGITISGTGGRIALNNTFEERLRLLERDALPSIRVTLFGDNKNRKFHD